MSENGSTKRTPFTGERVLAGKGGALRNVFSNCGHSDATAPNSQKLFSCRSCSAKKTAACREGVLAERRCSYHKRCSEQGAVRNALGVTQKGFSREKQSCAMTRRLSPRSWIRRVGTRDYPTAF